MLYFTVSQASNVETMVICGQDIVCVGWLLASKILGNFFAQKKRIKHNQNNNKKNKIKSNGITGFNSLGNNFAIRMKYQKMLQGLAAYIL